MAKYEVQVPLVGSYWCRVEAETEEDAKEKALSAISIVDIKSDLKDFEVDALEPMSQIMNGNICYAPLWEIEIEEQ